MYITGKSPFTWNLGKNLKLKLERGVSFEEVQSAVRRGAYRIVQNRSANHPGQTCFLVVLHRTKWLVPFQATRNSIYLFTILRA